MKIVLVGYPGSQKIKPITENLLNKYLPEFELIFLNYEGNISGWSEYCWKKLEGIEDESIIFTLDDYWINSNIDERYSQAVRKLTGDVRSVRLNGSERDGIQENYSVTAQYCVWDKDTLVEILKETDTPWDFEINGTRIYNEKGYKTYGFREPIIKYSDCSVMSERHPGMVNVEGLNEEDIKLVLKHFKEDQLILGQMRGEPVLWKESL
jgi:hypothetical protein